MKFNIKKTSDGIGLRLNGLKKDLAKLPDDAITKMKALTPIDTGNARSKTSLTNRSTIKANYEYATALDNGHSKQAPTGMTKPLFHWLDQKVNLIVSKR